MKAAMLAVVVGIVVYIVANTMITTLVEGTTTGDVLLRTLVPLAIAVGIVLAALGSFMKGK